MGLVCSGPGSGELVELGFDLGTVSCKALAVGEKGGLGGSHSLVRSLKKPCGHGEGHALVEPPLSQFEAREKTRLSDRFALLNTEHNQEGGKGTSCSFLPELLVFLVPVGTSCTLPPVCFPVCEMGMRTVPVVEKIN